VITLAENLKSRIDIGAANRQRETIKDMSDTLRMEPATPIDDEESQMRKALGLLGETPRHRPEPERSEAPTRTPGTLGMFGGGGGGGAGGLHRRRFVQDGDVPVTVLRRGEAGPDAAAHRGAAAPLAAQSSRLQRAESLLAIETATREKAERALHDALQSLRDLQTKIGHAELARNEAQDILRREREAAAASRTMFEGLTAELAGVKEQLQDSQKDAEALQRALDEEKRARKAAEKAQKAAEEELDEAKRLISTLESVDTTPTQAASAAGKTRKAAVKANADLFERTSLGEPEPVKWWLNAKTPAKRR